MTSSEIYVQPFPGPGGEFQISSDGGTAPTWTVEDELLYQRGREMMSVAIETAPSFAAANPVPLFTLTESANEFRRNYDVTKDGDRFVVVDREDGESRMQQLNVVLNWFSELERLMPVE